MNLSCSFLMTLAVLEASAKPQINNSHPSTSFHIIKGGYGSSVPSVKTDIETSMVENPTLILPSFIPPATISQSCHCLKTIMRPHTLKEIITVPTVERILRTVATPTVETVETPLETFTQKSILLSGVRENKNNLGGILQNDIFTLSGSNNGLSGEENAGSFSNSANGASLNKSDKASGNMISQPSNSAFLNVKDKNYLCSTSTIFSGNGDYLNDGHISEF